MDRVLEELSRARDRLLDLSARNRLLNFRPSRRASVRVVDEMPDEVWRLLVVEGKNLSFLAREEHELFGREAEPIPEPEPEPDEPPALNEVEGAEPPTAAEPEAIPPAGPWPTAPADDQDRASAATDTPQAAADEAEPDAADEPAELFALPDMKTAMAEGEMPARYQDLFLQTNLDGENLQTNLLRIEQSAQSALEERGVNFLFLAMGFVSWKENPASGRHAQHGHVQQFRAPVLLVPVKLERAGVRKRFKLSVLDAEPIVNPCLTAKLEQEYRLSLPPAPEDWEGFDVDDYLRSVEKLIGGQGDWHVEREIYLSLFSFTKYLMYLDLDPSRWPSEGGLTDNPLVRAMCGDDEASITDLSDLPDAADVIDRLDPEEVFQVQDADSSQIGAILAAKAGKSLVIEGPPGTGKSQTITNVIAECLAAGKTVLFVSEKMAALEVVKARLERAGLGDFCLELHSTKSNRRTALEAMNRAWKRSAETRQSDGAAKLTKLRDRLNRYVEALHAPLGDGRLTPYQAMGRFALLTNVPDVICEMPGFDRWGPGQIESLKESVEQLGRQLAVVDPIAEHPWRGARVRIMTGQTLREVTETLEKFGEAIELAKAAGERTAGLLGAAAPRTQTSMKRLAAAAGLVRESPQPDARLMSEELWDEPAAELEDLLANVRAHVAGLDWLANRYQLDAVKSIDWRAMQNRCMAYWASIGRWFRPQYWRDRKEFQAALAAGHRPSFAEKVTDIKQLAALQDLRTKLEESREVGERYFGGAWRGPESDWSHILKLNDWLREFRAAVRAGAVGEAGMALATAGGDRAALAAAADRLGEQLDAWDGAWSSLSAALAMDELRLFAGPMADAFVDEVAQAAAEMAQRPDDVYDWAQFQDALQTCEAGPLAAFAARAIEDVEPELLAMAFEKQHMRLTVEAAMSEREQLRQFNAAAHDADRKAFAQADRDWVRHTGRRLQAKLAAERPALNTRAARSSQVGILLGEINRKRGGRSIRRLLRDAGEAIQRLTPCFMMSPLSVSQFIDPAGIRFDVVVFDEASQVEPADALGSVARGNQLLLVGDPKQLPPTTFFSAMGGEDGSVDDDGMAGITDMESILHRGLAVLPKLRLRWHYRSRHESLIAFSNHEFYDGELIVFPSCHADSDELGLRMRYEPDDLYGRGRSQKNRDQARRIAEWVFEFARRRPDLSLGIGAFSNAQQQAVLDEIEKLRIADDSAEAFFSRERLEPFFVKNLETIQGDERDVIALSVGYGKSRPGERLSMNFGPLNQDGGWRRLNVLVTRARNECVVFSSVRAEDFDLKATQARGVVALHDYLQYAMSRWLPEIRTGDEAGSDFERAVYNALVEHGLTLRREVGCVGYAIDMAVVDPENPGRYLLAIECDGPMYQNTACARDRDRLRQQVLEGLGWKIHRVWATDWFRKPRAEVERVLAAVRKAQAGRWEPMLPDAPAEPARYDETGEAADDGTPAELTLAEPYRRYKPKRVKSAEDFYVCPIDDVTSVLEKVVAIEGPVHEETAVRRIAATWGLSRVGSKIRQRAHLAVKLCRQREKFDVRDGFLWPTDMDAPPVRRRDDEDDRDIDMICLAEIALAARRVLESQIGMTRPDLVTQTARVLGFATAGTKVTARVDEAIDKEMADGKITADESGTLRAEQLAD